MKYNNGKGKEEALNKNSFRASLRSGFTLIEMLTVVLIIGILTAVMLPQYRRAIQRARVTEAIAMLRVIYDSGERLAAEFGYKTFANMASSDKAVFTRMDMFDQNTIACALAGKVMTCEHFVYEIENTRITATQRVSPNVTISLTYPTGNEWLIAFSCEGNDDACEVYGFECSGSGSCTRE